MSYVASAAWKYHMKASSVNIVDFWSVKMEQWRLILSDRIPDDDAIICKEQWTYVIKYFECVVKAPGFHLPISSTLQFIFLIEVFQVVSASSGRRPVYLTS